MKTLTIALLPLFVLAVSALSAPADTVTRDEAWTVAENWVTLVIKNEGSWGGADTAGVDVREVLEFRHGERLLGYLCNLEPDGYVVVSLSKGLTPVAAYSETGTLDPDSEEGMAAFVKDEMERAMDAMGKPAGQQAAIQGVEASTHLATWELLECDIEAFGAGLDSGVIALNYEGGEPPLLTSSWHQGEPYNRFCPPGDDCDHCKVGCVALAGAQIMRYWAWPPQGEGQDDDVHYDDEYGWQNMANLYGSASGDRWCDEDGQLSLTMTNVGAVAALCREVGKAAGVDYGCSDSSAWCGDKPLGKDMLEAYEDHFRYSNDADFDLRYNNSDADWYQMIKDNLNANRPLQYCVTTGSFPSYAGHSLVLDGWKVEGGTLYWHMNDGTKAWSAMTDMSGAEGMIKRIRPAPYLGDSLSGNYSVPSFPYRYFDQDASGQNATFDAGHNLQFLPGVAVHDNGSGAGDRIRFSGTPSDNTRLFSIKGTSTGGLVAGIRIYDGGIRLYGGSSLRFH